MTPWLATFVRRWHTNPHLGHTVDPISAHSGRMGVLALDFFGLDGDLLAACLTHDLGEHKTGDIPYGAANKDHAAEYKALEDMGLYFDCDFRKLKFLDLLDSYLWARHHNPELVYGSDWEKQLLTIRDMAYTLEVSSKLDEYI